MQFKTKQDMKFTVVPDKAICKRVNKNQNYMDKCPIAQFDPAGKFCVPEKCEFYGEVGFNNE